MVEVFSAAARHHHQRILLAPPLPVLASGEASVTANAHTLLLQSLVPLPQVYVKAQQQASSASQDGEETGPTANNVPLDLSCKGPLQPPPIHPRTSSTSSTASSCASFSSTSSFCCSDNDERRTKRKEQNKAAAQSYRQRKKSFSDQVEAEVEELMDRNVRLKAQKCKLEEQIGRMRSLLEETVKREASAAVCKKEIDDVDEDAMSEPMHSPPGLYDGSEGEEMRSRKYTWPLTLNGKERKKEQNKLASRRFRQRRKQEQSHSEQEATRLECDNKRLRERCDELTTKINLMKNLMSRSNASPTAVKQQP